MLMTLFSRINLRKHCIVNFNRCRGYSNLSYIHKLGNEPLRATTLGILLEQTAKKYRDRPSIISRFQRKTVTFGELLEEADRLAAGLLALGLKKGDRVGLCLPNQIEWNIVLFACTRAGLILVALNPAYQPPELEYCINKVGISAMIFCDKFKTQNYYEIITAVCPEVAKSDPGKIKSGKTPTLQSVIIISEDTFRGAYNYNEILHFSKQNIIRELKLNQNSICPDSPSVIQFTSGTTGKPKASVASHFSMVNNSYHIAKRSELNTKHHIACVMNPLFHGFGITINSLADLHFGTTFVIPGQAYNPNESLDALKELKCTFIYGTPTMYVDLVDVQTKRQENINPETALIGGAPCSPHLFQSMLDVLKVKKVKSVYGLTECTAVVFHSLPDEDLYKSATAVGYIGDHLEAKVIDGEGRMVPFGKPGELCIRGYVNMLEYWEDEETTKKTIGGDGWLKTGDQFVLEEDGYGRIVGRIKDMIIRGGENIFPKEIEDFLNTHPDILESQVIGVPHERLGEEVCAFVRLKDGKTFDQKNITEYCKGKIAHFKIPSLFQVIDNFPKTASGKIQKFKLKELIGKSK